MAEPESLYGPRLVRQKRARKPEPHNEFLTKRRLLLSLAIITTVSVLATSVVIPDTARHVAAGSAPLLVWGRVTNLNGSPVEGATVNITIVESGALRTVTTYSDGNYSNAADEFVPSDYQVNDTIRVTARYNSFEASNTTTIDEDVNTTGIAQVDVRFTVEIPEFGGPIGLLVAASFMIGMFVIAARSRRS